MKTILGLDLGTTSIGLRNKIAPPKRGLENLRLIALL